METRVGTIGLYEANDGQLFLFRESDRIKKSGITVFKPAIMQPFTGKDWTKVSLRTSWKYIVGHHTGVDIDQSPQQIDDYHIRKRQFFYIGYHWYIDMQGIIYEGRPSNRQGAHVENYNEICLGFCVAGNFEEHEPNPKQRVAIWNLLSWVIPTFNVVYAPHHLFCPTPCPGRHFTFGGVK